MATWDTADLVARFERTAGLPAAREFPQVADIYAYLTEANVQWTNAIAQHAPWSQYGAPVKLTTADAGATYDFPAGADPIGAIELYTTNPSGQLLMPGAYWDSGADYTFEGDKVRITTGRTRTFSDGPYARYMQGADTIDASNSPVLKPLSVNILNVYTACAIWARRGGHKDPRPFLQMAQEAWIGDGQTQLGILAMLKTMHAFQGMEAIAGIQQGVLDFVNTGEGYQAI